MMASLFPRGTRKAVSRIDLDNGEDDAQDKKAHEALASMRFTCRWCFASVLANLLVTMMNDGVWNEPFTWRTAVDMAQSLNLLIFGHGLTTVTKLYRKSLASRVAVTYDDACGLCQNMARIWRSTAWSLVGVATSLAASLGEQKAAGSGAGPASFLSAPVGVVAAAALGSLAARRRCARDVAEAVEGEAQGVPLKPDAERARLAGFRACRNMALCMGSFVLLATVQLATWVLKPVDLVWRLFSVTNFITPYTIAWLLFALYGRTLKTVVAVTGGRSPFPVVGFNAHDDLYEAQMGFYSKVGMTLKSTVLYSLLPYLFAYIKPFLVPATVFVAPSLAAKLN